MTVMIFDHRGSSDLLRITDVGGEIISVDPMEGVFPAYPPGSAIIPVDVHSYYFDAPRAQVRHHDGWRTDAPVLDHVVALSFQYFGSSLQPDRRSEREGLVCSTVARPWNGVSGPEVELLPDVLTDGPGVDLDRCLMPICFEYAASGSRYVCRPRPLNTVGSTSRCLLVRGLRVITNVSSPTSLSGLT